MHSPKFSGLTIVDWRGVGPWTRQRLQRKLSRQIADVPVQSFNHNVDESNFGYISTHDDEVDLFIDQALLDLKVPHTYTPGVWNDDLPRSCVSNIGSTSDSEEYSQSVLKRFEELSRDEYDIENDNISDVELVEGTDDRFDPDASNFNDDTTSDIDKAISQSLGTYDFEQASQSNRLPNEDDPYKRMMTDADIDKLQEALGGHYRNIEERDWYAMLNPGEGEHLVQTTAKEFYQLSQQKSSLINRLIGGTQVFINKIRNLLAPSDSESRFINSGGMAIYNLVSLNAKQENRVKEAFQHITAGDDVEYHTSLGPFHAIGFKSNRDRSQYVKLAEDLKLPMTYVPGRWDPRILIHLDSMVRSNSDESDLGLFTETAMPYFDRDGNFLADDEFSYGKEFIKMAESNSEKAENHLMSLGDGFSRMLNGHIFLASTPQKPAPSNLKNILVGTTVILLGLIGLGAINSVRENNARGNRHLTF